MNDAADPIEMALVVTRALDKAGIAHTIGGSIASSVAGGRPLDSQQIARRLERALRAE